MLVLLLALGKNLMECFLINFPRLSVRSEEKLILLTLPLHRKHLNLAVDNIISSYQTPLLTTGGAAMEKPKHIVKG